MPYDAKHLWWPPLQRLADRLLSAQPGDNLDSLLAEYGAILSQCTAFFRPPSEQSKKVLESDASLAVGGKKLPIDAALRRPVLDASLLLGLDELQTLVLLRRWAAEGGESMAGGDLSARQRASLAEYYTRERALLLSCLEQLLQTEPGDAEDPLAKPTKQLLADGLEQSVVSALLAAAEQQQLGAADALPQLSLDWPHPRLRRRLAALELPALLDAAALLFARQRLVCGLERGLQLLTALRPLLTAGSGEPPGPASLDFQAFALLLAALDLGGLAGIVAAGTPLTAQAHGLGSKDARQQVDGELRAWGPPRPSDAGQATLHGPLLLGWATFLCLANSAAPPEEELPWQPHADAAWTGGALQTLAGALQVPGALSHLQAGLLQQLACAFLGSFRLGPAGLPAPALHALLGLLAGVHQGDEELCEAVWEGRAPVLLPLRSFLEEARDLFPAFPTPLLRLLAALACGPAAAAAAADFLVSMPHLTSRHEQGDPALREQEGAEGPTVVAAADVQVCGLTVSEGSQGRLLPEPSAAGASEAVSRSLLVRWEGALKARGGGFLLLLAFVRSSLDSLRLAAERPRQAGGAGGDPPAAASLGQAASLLAQLPSLYVPGALLEVRGATLPRSLAQALQLLAQQPAPPLDSMGSCLEVLRGLAGSLAGAVAGELARTQLFWAPGGGGAAAGERWDVAASLPDSQPLRLRELSSRAEAAEGRYPVTRGTLQLAARLLAAGIAHPFLQAAVGLTLTHVLPRTLAGRFAAAGERWRTAAAALQLLTAALAHAPAAGGPDVAGGLRRALAQRGAAAAFLFGALPPPAAAAGPASGAEAAALESALAAWFALVPALLRGGEEGQAAALAEPFFQAQGQATAPAAVLASWLTHPLLPPALGPALVSSLAALATAAAPLGHVCFVACLPHTEDGSAVDPGFRRQLLAPLQAPEAAPEGAFAAACQLLLAAADHPSLQGVLLFPTALEAPKAAEQGSDAAGKAPEGGKPTAKRQPGALDGLLAVLKAAAGPQETRPQVLALALQALLALWQGGPTCYGAVQLLKAQPGFWQALAAAVPQALQRRLDLDPAESAAASARTEAAWKLAAEAAALQILALEAFRHPRPDQGEEDSGVWEVLDSWAAEAGGGRLASLLPRYGAAPQGVQLAADLRAAAGAAAAALLDTLAGDAGLAEHLAPPGSLLGRLRQAAAAQPDAGSQAAQQELGALLLAAAEAPEDSEPGTPAYGPCFLYSADRLADRTGAALFRSLEQLQALGKLLSAASAAAGVEHARLAALGALAAALAVTPAAGTPEAAAAHLEALEAAVQPLLLLGQAPAVGLLRPREDSLAFAEEVTKAVLMQLQRSRGRGLAEPKQAAAFARRTARLARRWLDAAAASPGLAAQEGLTTGLLAACLHALQSAPGSARGSKEAEQLQLQLAQLLPWLCRLAAGGGRQAAVSLALLTSAVGSHLPPVTWLPILRASLDLSALVSGAFDRQAAARAADAPGAVAAGEVALAALHLVLAACQEAGAAAWLSSAALLDALHAAARWLLSPAGGLPVWAQEPSEASPEAAASQRQWLALLSLQALLVRGPRALPWASMAAIRFAVVSHARLIEALQAPMAAAEGPPLRLAAVQEAERSACFLAGLAGLAGEWLAALPHGPAQARAAASDLLAFTAAGSTEPELRVACLPSDAGEQALAAQPAGLSALEGWFGLCAAGAAVAGRPQPDPGQQSELTAQLAEGLYGAACHCLVLLAALAPEGGVEAAQASERGWPAPDALLALQGQCIALSHELEGQPTGGSPQRAARLCTRLSNLLVAAARLQERLQYPQPRGHAAQVAETLERLQQAGADARR